MRPLDTSAEIAAMQLEAYRQLGPAGRLRVALSLSDLTHRFAEAGIRHRNPELTKEEVKEALAALLYPRPRKP